MIRYYIIVVLLLFYVDGNCQQKENLEKKRKETLKDIENTQSILDGLNQSKSNSIEKLKLLDKQITNRNLLVENLSNQIEISNNEISEQEILINSTENDISKIKIQYAGLILASYKKHKKGNILMYIFSSETFDQAYKRLQYVKQYTYYRNKQIAMILEVQKSLKNKKMNLEISKTKKQNLLKNKEKELTNLASEKTQQSLEIENLKKKETVLKKELQEKIRIANKLQKEIENIILSDKQNRKKEIKKVSNESRILTGNFKDNKGRLPWPLDKGIIVNTFGEQDHPILKGVRIRNNGIDISTYSNARVYSIYEGEVKKVFSILGSNYTVIVRHGEFLSVYQNLINVTVKSGDRLKAKQEIGALYSDSKTNNSILHLEIWEEANKLNPELWLSKN